MGYSIRADCPVCKTETALNGKPASERDGLVMLTCSNCMAALHAVVEWVPRIVKVVEIQDTNVEATIVRHV